MILLHIVLFNNLLRLWLFSFLLNHLLSHSLKVLSTQLLNTLLPFLKDRSEELLIWWKARSFFYFPRAYFKLFEKSGLFWMCLLMILHKILLDSFASNISYFLFSIKGIILIIEDITKWLWGIVLQRYGYLIIG